MASKQINEMSANELFSAFVSAIRAKDKKTIERILNRSQNFRKSFPDNLDLEDYCRYLYLTGQDFDLEYMSYIEELEKHGNKAIEVVYKYFDQKGKIK